MTLLKKMLPLAATVALAAFVSTEAAAATSMAPDAFDALYATIAGWCKGTLGKSISLAFLVIGLSLGIIRGFLVAHDRPDDPRSDLHGLRDLKGDRR